MDVQVRMLEQAASMGYAVETAGAYPWPQVDVQPVYDRDGKAVPGYIRIFREDSGDTLAIHTSNYQLRPYGDSFKALEDAIELSNLDKRGLMTKTEFSHNGARCFRSYLFPHIAIDMGEGDVISLQILAFDSYDGTYSTSIAAGGFRHICLNGSYFGKTIQQLKIKHIKGSLPRFENALEKVIEAAEAFVAMAPRLKQWKTVSLSVHDFKLLLQGMPQHTERLVDHLVSRYATEAEEHTLYGAWNVMTSWASTEDGTAQSRIDRDRRVAGLIDSRQWKIFEDVF